MNDMAKNLILWVVIALVLMSVFQTFTTNNTQSAAMNYSDFIAQVNDGNIESVEIDQYGRTISGRLSSGESFSTVAPADDQLVSDLLKNNVQIKAEAPEVASIWQSIFVNLLPIFLLLGIWIFFMRQMQGGGAGRGAMSFGKSRARMLTEDQVKVTFADVAGADEAKEEVVEMVDFLRDPSKFQKLGGKIPKGVLMVGSPGTGKTLLARAIAGEAKVPFFTISGSDFVEMFVGVGASRVRDMFEQAKKHAPCIIFIDEIDAVGRHRGAGLGGGHDEREQTLNQLLVEMDGFEGNEGVIVIAATNRPDVLDPALLRPGRFARQVVVPMPDIRGREQILKVHLRKVPAAEDLTVIIQGFGAVGAHAARQLVERFPSAKIVGISDLDGYLYDPSGLPLEKLLRTARRHGLVTRRYYETEIAAQGHHHSTKFSTDADNLLRESAFCFMPAAPVFNYLGVRPSEASSMNVNQMGNWSIIVEGANTYSPDPNRKAARTRMEQIVDRRKGVMIANDYLVNSVGNRLN